MAVRVFILLGITGETHSQCGSPSSLYTEKQNDTLLHFEWISLYNDIVAIEDYDAEYRELNTEPWIKARLFASNYELAYVKIEPGKCYELRVRMFCLGNGYADTSDWASTIYYDSTYCQLPRTSGDCHAPGDLRPSGLKDSTIALSWTQVVDPQRSTHYDAEVREINTPTWKKAYFQYGNDSENCMYSKAVTGKCYEWRVRTICATSATSSDTSEWVYTKVNTGTGSCLDVPPPPPITVVTPDFSYTADPCFPARIKFSNNTIASGTGLRSHEWDLGDNSRTSAPNPVHNYQKPGDYKVTLTVTDSAGKTYSKTAALTIQMMKLNFADAGKDAVVCNSDTIQLQASGGEKYSWEPCAGLSNCTSQNPILARGNGSRYIVTVTNKDGCADKDTINIKFIDPSAVVYIPNAFTPNHDGLNDLFRPVPSSYGTPAMELKIFNRFGNLVYTSESLQNGWDGRYKGEPQPAGNFTYLIRFKTTEGCTLKPMKGTVLLIR